MTALNFENKHVISRITHTLVHMHVQNKTNELKTDRQW